MENARPSSISITITPQILTDLVYFFEAVSDLEEVVTKLYGELIVPDIGEGILGNLWKFRQNCTSVPEGWDVVPL